MLTAAAVVVVALASPTPTTAVRAELDVDAQRVRGEVEVRAINPTDRPLTRAYLWLYPNRFARRPRVDDVEHYWLFPRAFDAGWMRVSGAHQDGAAIEAAAWRPEPHAAAGRRVLWSVELPHPVAPGGELRLRVAYDARVPRRYGGFGCVDGGCTLAGGFYPMLASIDAGGWDLAGAPLATDMTVALDLRDEADVILWGELAGQGAVRATASARAVPYAVAFVAPRWHASTRRAGDTELVVYRREPPPPADDARRAIVPYTQEDYAGHALDAAQRALAVLAELGAPAPPRLAIVEVPLRFDLAEPHPGGVVAMSDRWLRLWPADRFRALHVRQLARAVFAAIYAARGERDADALASFLTDLFAARRGQREPKPHAPPEYAQDFLRPVAFIPVVDLFLYAPQVAFADAYFGNVLERDVRRDHPLRFNHARPRGRLVYEKLRDRLGPEGVSAAMVDAARGAGVQPAAERAAGADLAWLFRQWELPPAAVNYRLAGVRTVWRAGSGYEHAIEIAVEVAPGQRAPIEAVELLVIDAAGERHRLRWDGGGDRHVFTLITRAPLDVVELDPRRRLAESPLPGVVADPLLDNRRPGRLRFVYNSFGVLFTVSDLSALLAADFSLSRLHDVRNRSRFLLFRSASVVAGLRASYTRQLGPLVAPDTTLGAATVSLTALRLSGDFFADDGEEARGATRVAVSVGFGQSDRTFEFEPLRSRGWGAAASLGLTRLDAVAGAGAEHLVSGGVSAGYTVIATPWDGHTFAASLGAGAVYGQLRDRSQLERGGGPTGSRGYRDGELYGRARAEARAEYRHVYVHDLDWNFGHYTFLRGIGGALFVDVVALTPEDSWAVGEARVYPSAGYGLRFFYDSFGTIQQMMRLDVALRLEPGALDVVPGIYLSFLPPF